MNQIEIVPFYFENNGIIPNNKLPVLIYKNTLQDFEFCFSQNEWTNNWQDIILPTDHFHSNTHEVLGLQSGHARLKIGGQQGEIISVEKGDVLILPAGVGHYSVDNTLAYQFIGGYPNGADWNLKFSLKNEDIQSILTEIANIPIPEKDPVFGIDGPLFDYWK